MTVEGFFALVLEVAVLAFKVRVGVVGLAVGYQCILIEVLTTTQVALERLPVGVAHVFGD